MTDSSSQPASPITVVNVISTSYSGSTWVNLLLGSHSQAFSVGEIKSILKVGKPVCTVHGESCPLWSGFEHPSSQNVFVQLAQRSGKNLLIVNNSRKFLSQEDHPQIRRKFIHLMRDGRAVTASFMRKFPEMGAWKAARTWAHDVRRNQRLIRRQPAQDTLLVIYEKLKADPEPNLREICTFLGLSYEPAMVNFWEHAHHFLGGNRGTLFSMLRKTEPRAALPDTQANAPRVTGVKDWDLKHYEKNDPAQFKDERWKTELTDKQLRIFALAGGLLNRRYGYPRALDRT
jgi:hypothetical protein